MGETNFPNLTKISLPFSPTIEPFRAVRGVRWANKLLRKMIISKTKSNDFCFQK